MIDDHGPGLPKNREEAIFQKFERGRKESATPGVGLGLAICRAIVEAHGGTIAGETRPDGGARFIDRAAARRAARGSMRSRRKSPRGGRGMSEPTPRILVVEDEAEIRRFVRLSLERDGFEVYRGRRRASAD